MAFFDNREERRLKTLWREYLDGTLGGGSDGYGLNNRQISSFTYSGSQSFTLPSVPRRIYEVRVYNTSATMFNPVASYSWTAGTSIVTLSEQLQAGDVVYVDYDLGYSITGTPVAGDVPTYQSNGSVQWAAQSGGGGGGSAPTLADRIASDEFFTHLHTIDGFAHNSAGAGSANSGTRAGKEGVIILSTAANATARSGLIRSNGATNNILLGSASRIYEHTVMFPLLSTATEEFHYGFGLTSNTSDVLNGGDMLVMGYQRSATGDFWVTKTRNNNGTVTGNTSAVAVTALTWYKLRIEINLAGTQADFYVNDVLIATHTTNMPGSTRAMFATSVIHKTAGTTARTAEVDYWYDKFNTAA